MDATSFMAFFPLARSPSLFKYHKNDIRQRSHSPRLLQLAIASRIIRVLTRGRGERLAGGKEPGLAAAVPAPAANSAAAAALQLLLLLLLRGRLLGGQLLLLGLRRAEVGVLDRLLHIHPIVLPVGEAPPDEVLGLVADGRLRGELHFGRLQDDVLLEDRRLGLIVSERLKILIVPLSITMSQIKLFKYA